MFGSTQDEKIGTDAQKIALLPVSDPNPELAASAKSPTNEPTANAIIPEPRSVGKQTRQSAVRAGASGQARTEDFHRRSLPLFARARLAHPKPPLVRGPAELAGPALGADSLTKAGQVRVSDLESTDWAV